MEITDMIKRKPTRPPLGMAGTADFSNLRPEPILKALTGALGVTIDQLRIDSRKAALVEKRHIVHYFLSFTDLSLTSIGAITKKDHASVMHSRVKVEQWDETNKDFRTKLARLGTAVLKAHNESLAKVQLIGKVTGIDRAAVVEKFLTGQTTLTRLGYDVVNPVAIISGEIEWREAMKVCLLQLFEVDAIGILPDWQDSRGARLEYHLAKELGLKEIWL